jgi:hypothetical protein
MNSASENAKIIPSFSRSPVALFLAMIKPLSSIISRKFSEKNCLNMTPKLTKTWQLFFFRESGSKRKVTIVLSKCFEFSAPARGPVTAGALQQFLDQDICTAAEFLSRAALILGHVTHWLSTTYHVMSQWLYLFMHASGFNRIQFILPSNLPIVKRRVFK